MNATNLLTIVCLSFLTLGVPGLAHAATWDFLFTDLSWPEAGNPVGGGVNASIGSFTSVGTQGGTSGQGSNWDYLFTDLSWPEETSPVSGTSQGGSIGNFVTSGIVEGTSTSSSGFWDFLFTDLKWPDATSSAIGGL
ncbi:MAG: hypothetical protein PHN33_02670 [Candidatus Peribacteraceae bacterium]|nr:hypothetical protein [Candidatus Peribacteraceae bacterium]